ncbi:hypothetical protein KM043_003485 [Ampulex compressa]|nr:hypothetical protein KM043_003485 [Ampulex compressa]
MLTHAGYNRAGSCIEFDRKYLVSSWNVSMGSETRKVIIIMCGVHCPDFNEVAEIGIQLQPNCDCYLRHYDLPLLALWLALMGAFSDVVSSIVCCIWMEGGIRVRGFVERSLRGYWFCKVFD